MERIAVRSRDIAVIGYDESKASLEVAFRAGGVYHYEQVPPDVYRAFLKAESHGCFFRENIRERYAFKKVSG
ncbi:MAG: KTSC domain-containing protein [Candidatus Omnitrophica bacterium]|nr:KTSC domain-containing protein [Candidatus Omnitrophota bacterium]